MWDSKAARFSSIVVKWLLVSNTIASTMFCGLGSTGINSIYKSDHTCIIMNYIVNLSVTKQKDAKSSTDQHLWALLAMTCIQEWHRRQISSPKMLGMSIAGLAHTLLNVNYKVVQGLTNQTHILKCLGTVVASWTAVLAFGTALALPAALAFALPRAAFGSGFLLGSELPPPATPAATICSPDPDGAPAVMGFDLRGTTMRERERER